LFLDFAVTWRCNARCIMCNTWRSDELNPQGIAAELSPAEIEAILRREGDFLGAVGKVGLTGGEPFLRKDLPDIVRVLHRLLPRARMTLVSNGLLTERVLAGLGEIKDFFPELVFSVSLDGVGSVHDQVRGVPGAFDKAMATVRGALKLGFTVTSGMTISAVNFDQIEPMSDLLAGLGVDFSCNLQERGANFHSDGRAEDLGPAQTSQVRRALGRFPHHYYMDQVRRQLEGQPRTLPCYAGMSSYFITPSGDVTICNLMGQPLGNLREQGFREIANGTRAWRLRRELASCSCWSQCEVKNSAASAPWHMLKWLSTSPHKKEILRHYAGKAGKLLS
jgi:MoaA/NifB/PqqE/SkfB family radical SAM enzyme